MTDRLPTASGQATISGILDRFQALPSPARFLDPYFRDAMETALALAAARGAKVFVETGVATTASGAHGHSTALFAEVCELLGAEFHSCDIVRPDQIPAEIRQKGVRYTQSSSADFLAAFPMPADFFYLDAGLRDGVAAEAEVPHVLRLAHSKTVILIDDWDEEKRHLDYHGKGHRSVPLYLAAGWRPLLCRYQILLIR